MTARRLVFEIPGPPRGKGRPRFARAGKFVRAYTDDKTAVYENLVAWAARAELLGEAPFEGPVAVTIMAVLPPPKQCRRVHPHVKPDLDNLIKAILDGCNQARVWKDDAQVVDLKAVKTYGEPCCRVTVEAIA